MANRQAVIQLLGAISIATSLLFVGYEIKQSRDIAIAEIYQTRAALDVSVILTKLSDGPVLSVLTKWHDSEEELTGEEMLVLWTLADAELTIAENSHYQYQLGLLAKEEWLSYRNNSIQWALSKPCMSERLAANPLAYRASFREEIADLVAAAPKHDNCLP